MSASLPRRHTGPSWRPSIPCPLLPLTGGTGASAPPPPPHRTTKSAGAAGTSSLPHRDRRFVAATPGKCPLYKLVAGTYVLAIPALQQCTRDPLPLPLLGLAVASIRPPHWRQHRICYTRRGHVYARPCLASLTRPAPVLPLANHCSGAVLSRTSGLPWPGTVLLKPPVSSAITFL
jgi:hypothetical protein